MGATEESMADHSKIDLGPDAHGWQPVASLGLMIGVEDTAALISSAAKNQRCNGYAVERREATDEERERFGYAGRAKWVYRVKPEGVVKTRSTGSKRNGTPSLDELLEENAKLRTALVKAEELRATESRRIAELEEQLFEASEEIDRLELAVERRPVEGIADAVLVAQLKHAREALWDIAQGEGDLRAIATAALRESYEGQAL